MKILPFRIKINFIITEKNPESWKKTVYEL